MYFDGCDGAGILVVREDRVTTAAASHPLVVELDELQVATNEGPGLDVVAEGGSLYAMDLIDDER